MLASHIFPKSPKQILQKIVQQDLEVQLIPLGQETVIQCRANEKSSWFVYAIVTADQTIIQVNRSYWE